METASRLLRKELPEEIERSSHTIIGCALEVHRELGPGLLESLYEQALAYELTKAGLQVVRQAEIAVPYKEITLHGQRLDLIVNGLVIVELKAVSELQPIYAAQTLSYLRAAGLPLGLLFNFNTTLLREGFRRIFNERAKPPFGLRSPPNTSPAPTSSSSSRSSRPSR